MTARTEAERRILEYMKHSCAKPENVDLFALFRAIFDPLPPEPEPVKSLGQVAHDEWSRDSACEWADATNGRQAAWENAAQAIVKEHESRRPKPTVDEVARAMFRAHHPNRSGGLAAQTDHDRNVWWHVARAVFPLFGVTP